MKAGRTAALSELTSNSRTGLMTVALAGVDVVLRGVVAFARCVPERQLLGLAPVLGGMARGRRKQRCLANLKLFLGNEDWPEDQWERLWHAHTRHSGRTIVEVLTWQRLSADEVMGRVSTRGDEHLREALRQGRGVMLFANHLGNFVGLAPGLGRLGLSLCLSGHAMPTAYTETMLRQFMGRFGVRRQLLGRRLLATAAETFRSGSIFGAFVDLSTAGKREEWLRFGRAETNVSIGPALLALRHRVPVICVTCTRLDATRHEVTFHPPLRVAESGDRHVDARLLTAQALEVVAADIRRNPDQWWQWDFAPIRKPLA